MKARLSAVGSLAVLILLSVNNAQAQHATESRPAAVASEAAAPPPKPEAAPSEASAPEPASEAAPAEAASPAETSVEEAAAMAGEIQAPAGPVFDATKATRKEIEAYNANAAPDDRIVCRPDPSNTGSRMAKRSCRTVAQWRSIGVR